jgi:phage head maturation protease
MVDDIGVHVRCVPPETTWAKDLHESIERGDISGCSFRFWASPSDYEWTKDTSRGVMIGKLVRASKVDDFAIVTYPAYLQTDNSVKMEEDVLSRSLAEFVESETPETAPNQELTAEEVRSQIMLQRLRLMSV